MAFAFLVSESKESGGTVTTDAMDTTGATLLVAAISTASTLTSFVDSQNNIWFFTDRQLSGSEASRLAFCFNPTTSAAHTFTCVGSFASIAVAAFSGAAGKVVQVSGGASASNVNLNVASLTPPANDALIVTSFCCGTTHTQSINGGFTIAEQVGGTAGERVALAYLIQTTAAAAAPTWTSSGANSASAKMMVIPLDTGGGGGSTEHAAAF